MKVSQDTTEMYATLIHLHPNEAILIVSQNRFVEMGEQVNTKHVYYVQLTAFEPLRSILQRRGQERRQILKETQ